MARPLGRKDGREVETHVELGAAALEAVSLVHHQNVPIHLASEQRNDVFADAQLRCRHNDGRLPQPLTLYKHIICLYINEV